MVDHALAEHVTVYTGVAEMRWYEQIASFGWDCAQLGSPRRSDAGWLTALEITIGGETRARMLATGIYQDARAVRVMSAGAMEAAA